LYDVTITAGEAIGMAYKLASKDKVKDVALLLCGVIKRAYKEMKSNPWPPTADELTLSPDALPQDLQKFLGFAQAGKSDVSDTKTNRLVLSIYSKTSSMACA